MLALRLSIEFMRGNEFLPESHVPYEPIVLLHRKQAPQIFLRELVFTYSAQHEDVKTGVPPELVRIRAGRGLNEAIMFSKERRVTFA